MQLAQPAPAPSTAPTVAAQGSAGSGNVNNTEWYAVTFVTGVITSQGTMNIAGETTLGPISAAVTANNQSILVSNIPTGPSTVIARRIYRSPALPNPSTALSLSTVSNSSSTLAATTYYVNYALMNAQGTTTPGASEASITISTANAYAITFSVTLPSGATGILIGMGTSSGGEGQYAQISSSGAVTYVGGNSSGVSGSVNGSTLTVTITKPPSSTSTAMPSSNTANTNNYMLVTTIQDNSTTSYLDNIPDESLGQAAPTSNTTGSQYIAPALKAGGTNGLGSLRFVGTTNGGPPTSGTYNTGDVVLDLSTILLWICTSGGTPGTWTSLSYLRTDANAPNPQTVHQPVQFVGSVLGEYWLGTNWNATSYPQGSLGASSAGIYFGWNYTQGQGEGDIFIFAQGGQGGLNVYNTNVSSYPTFAKLIGVDGSGNMTVAGNISAANFARVQVFTSSTTWTVPQGVYRIFVQCWGGGGGGGGGTAYYWSANGSTVYGAAGGGGGGAGAYAEGWLSVSPGQTINVIVGAGGIGGGGTTAYDSSAGSGGNGGTSQVLSVIAQGGSGGGGASNTNNASNYYAGGGGQAGGYTALYGLNGSSGGNGSVIYNNIYGYYAGGNGGTAPTGGQYSSAAGLGGYSSGNGNNPNGTNGSGIGSGGGGGGGYVASGSMTAGNGGNGANGQVIIWW